MKILYCRVSTIEQKTDRQKINESEYSIIIEDKCSGSIPFFEREGGKRIKKFAEKEIEFKLCVWQIDRLGRNLRDILNTIYFFSQKKINIEFVSPGLNTLDSNGNENPISNMVISILGIVGEMERSQIRERQLEGIKIAKMKGVYIGRKKGSIESTLDFLAKTKNKKAIEYLKKGYACKEVAQLTNLHVNTVTKIKKLAFSKP